MSSKVKDKRQRYWKVYRPNVKMDWKGCILGTIFAVLWCQILDRILNDDTFLRLEHIGHIKIPSVYCPMAFHSKNFSD